MKIDITLRDILQNLPKRFIKILTGKSGKRLLDTSLPDVKDRRVDLLVELENDKIFHLELQSYNHTNMQYRMLEYWTLLKMKYFDRDILQMVLYVGDEKLNMKNKIDLKNIKFSYILKDIRDMDCEELLNSENIEDKILSILCKVEDEERLLIRVLRELYNVTESKRKDILLKILTLSRLRTNINKKLEKVIKEEKLPITIELEKDPYYLRGVEKGIEKGIEKGLELSIRRMYKTLNLSLEEISNILKVPIEQVKKAIEENNENINL